jgi:hypothetical protein
MNKLIGTGPARKMRGFANNAQQADGCQLSTLSPAKKQRDAIKRHMASIGISFNNFLFGMNSFRWLHYDNYQRRSPEQKHPEQKHFRTSFGVNLLVRRLFGGAPVR